jgi:hypothetical protein
VDRLKLAPPWRQKRRESGYPPAFSNKGGPSTAARIAQDGRKPRQLRVSATRETQKPGKIGIFRRKPKKTVENAGFSIDFICLEAAL